MALVFNNAEGGTDGSGVTAANSATSGNAFSQVNPGSGGSITYTATSPLRGSMSYLFTQPTAATACIADLDDTASSPDWAFSVYFDLPTLPTVSGQLWPVAMRSLSAALGNVQISTTGQLRLNVGTVTSAYSTPTLTAGSAVYRMEGQGTGWGSAASTGNIQVYVGDATGTPLISLSVTGATTNAEVQRFRWGKPSGGSVISGFRLDSIRQTIGSSAVIGPEAQVTNVSAVEALAVGIAYNATVTTSSASVSVNAQAQTAFATGSAPFETGSSIGIDYQVVGPVEAVGIALDATTKIAVNALPALAVGSANGASAGTVGNTSVDAGLASGLAAAYDATVLVTPGVYPFAAFGTGEAFDASVTIEVVTTTQDAPTALGTGTAFNAVVISESNIPYFFTTPSRRQRFYSAHGLWSRMYIDVGISVLRFGASYQQIIEPSAEEITAADAVFIGGRTYAINEAEAGLLRSAGYGRWVTDDPNDPISEIDYSQYGAGPYGSGTYGV